MSVKCYFSFDKLLTLDIAHRKLTKTRLLRNFNQLLFAHLNVNCVTPELHKCLPSTLWRPLLLTACPYWSCSAASWL